jgi:carbon-monoxide dehydrogenase medium subunit
VYRLIGYHRPATRAEALALLTQPDHLALAGGTSIRHDPGGRPTEVVDLQAADLAAIEVSGDAVVIGAMVDLQTIADDDRLPALVRELARLEQPSTVRTMATIGGTIAGGENTSRLLASLLVHDATVILEHAARPARRVPLAVLLERGPAPGELIVSASIEPGGRGAHAATGRTPADEPIVAAVGRRHADRTVLAICGAASTPVVVDPDRLDGLRPPGDHRGSPEYRRHLATVTARRVLDELR